MNPLYEFVSELKNRINKGEIAIHSALDLMYQHVMGNNESVPGSIPEQPPCDNAHVAEGCEQFPDPVPEPASEEPADGQTAVEGAE